MTVSVVLSFLNEEEVLPELIRRLVVVLSKEPEEYELVFINDSSTDGSSELLLQARAENPRIKIVNTSRRFGMVECIIAGLEYATGDAIIYLDTDLQDPPEVIPEMLAKWRDGADVVYTIRTKRKGENPLKMWLTRQAYRLIGSISDVDLPVDAGNFRLITSKMRDQILQLRETEPYLRGLVRWIGFRQEPVYYEREARHAGECHVPLFGTGPAKEFILGLTSFSTVPIFIILLVGLFTSALSFGGLSVIGLSGIWGGISGQAALIAFMGLLWGILMFSIGFVGIFVVRTYKDVRGRPRYIIKDTVGFDD
ncbi:MAG: glycosyltransferase [Alphaproteobacteria bacterium]|jgi:polyisoprenyl-phosphate glycosyltransferase|nr:glycosyltransferase [Alphaproteobacteria bacterium]MBT7943557.1 glycosyltransferase [Alphaproteobacteria bacterium]